MSLYSFFFSPQDKPLTAVEKMGVADATAAWALSSFHDLLEDFEHAAILLKEAIEEHAAEIDEKTRHLAEARSQLEKNNRVAEKVRALVS